ncbi:MAG: MATE family efflux transporter [Elusimicrobiota bacterium]
MPPDGFRANLTEGPVGKTLASLALPTVWGIFSIIAFNLADTYFVGQLGTKELAALSFTFPVVMAMGSLALGLAVGTSSLVARAIGEGDRLRVRRLTTNSLTLSLLVVGVFVACGLLTIDPLFAALGAGPEVRPLIREYMRIWYPGMVFVVIPMVGCGAIRGAGDAKTPSLIMTVAAGANVVLDPLLIFGLAGMPRLELEGAAIATVISRALTLAASLWILHYRERMLLLSAQRWGDMLRSWRDILAIGLPAGAANMIVSFSMGVIVSFVAGFGPEAVAGFGVATRIEAFTMIVLIALASSVGPFVGQNWGAGRFDRVHLALRQSFLFSLIWGLVMVAVLAAAGGRLAALFDPDPRVVAVAAGYLCIVPLGYGAEGVGTIGRSAFFGLGMPGKATGLTAVRMLVLYIPMAWAASRWFGIDGIFAAAVVTAALIALATYALCRRISRGKPAAFVPEERGQAMV